MKDAKGHGSNPRNGYFSRLHSSGKVAVYRKSTGTMVTKFANEASAVNHIARQNAEDHQQRVSNAMSYLAERSQRPAPSPPQASAQLNLFGSGADHVEHIATSHGINTKHLK